MACMGASDFAEFDYANKHGTRALNSLFRFVVSKADIDDSALPPSVLNAEDKEGEKARFQVPQLPDEAKCIQHYRLLMHE